MADRLNLHAALRSIFPARQDGQENLYFQPPESVKLNYPCIIYKRIDGDTKFADNNPYHYTQGYELLHIDRNPDSPFIKKLAMSFPMITYVRHYTTDNLNHDVYHLYY